MLHLLLIDRQRHTEFGSAAEKWRMESNLIFWAYAKENRFQTVRCSLYSRQPDLFSTCMLYKTWERYSTKTRMLTKTHFVQVTEHPFTEICLFVLWGSCRRFTLPDVVTITGKWNMVQGNNLYFLQDCHL